jgi:lipopolysaccharide export system protein LptC
VTITDPVLLVFDDNYMRWTLHQGRECFYDDQGIMRLWDTLEEARAWAVTNLKTDPVEVLAEPQHSQSKRTFDDKPRQAKLL